MNMENPLTEEERSGHVAGLMDVVPERMAKQTSHYDVEYGLRIDDKAMIFHFYAPGTDWSEYPPKNLGTWDPNYRMHDRLERAMPEVFEVSAIKAVYTEETKSFCIIVGGLGHAPDPFYYVHRFFEKIDAALDAPR
jgi:hypothetical protein